MATTRIELLKVPLDIVPPEELESTILSLLERNGPQHIMFITLWDLLRARRKGEFRSMVLDAALVLPLSKSLISGARFLHKPVPHRYHPFNFIISSLTVLESYCKSLYLFGAHQRSLMLAERNVRSTFPGLSVVGRYAGYFHRTMERNIMTAISKAHPSLLLIGDGIPGGRRWIFRNKSRLHNGLFLYADDVIEVFADRKRRVSEELFEKGLEYLPSVLKNPLRIFRIFQYLWYTILLLFSRLFRSST